jgi:RNA polymerase sigma factor (sigma-70 family)
MEVWTMTDDAELLSQYARDRSEAAFAELVSRHVDLVYSASLRQCRGDHHRAREVTQMVFSDLARKASALVRHPVLPAWLHRSSRLAALDLLRREGRRRGYEMAAGAEAAVTAPDGNLLSWEEVRPVLDEAIDTLDERDRQAILLRYFGNRPFGEVGQSLKLSENAARMRVERALEKLRVLLARRGITSSSAALAAALTGNAVAAAPAGLAAASATAAISIAGGVGAGWLALMTATKVNVSLAAAILVAGTAVVAIQAWSMREDSAAAAAQSSQNQEIPVLAAQNASLAQAAGEEGGVQDESATLAILRRQVGDLEAKAGAEAAAARNRAARVAELESGQPVYDISRLDQRPAATLQVRPEYPPSKRQAGAAGEALVDFVVGSDGAVYNAFAATSTDKEFAEAAVKAVSQWTFKPGQVGGQNVYTHMQVPIVFTLSSDPPPAPTSDTWF